jgi:ATP-dependent helicase/nuclease subunit A
MLTDSLERELALSCDQSFIVQAPAGSGKTELLSRRFLKLLATVENPEQIVALTFTKKAAFEMRTRIIEALQKNPLEVDRRNEWHLIENPHRLRIYTIDSFCSQLAKNLPVTAGMGGMPDIEDNPNYLYQKAIENYLYSIENEGEGSEGLCLILQHFHNRYEVVEKLFLSMLTRRDQWLHLVMSARRDPVKIKKVIQNSILSIHEETYTHLSRLLSENLKQQWLNLASFAASQLSLENKPHALLACLNITDFPDNTYDYQLQFLGLYELLFTASGTLRKRVDKNVGFPPTSPEMKKLYFEFIAELEKNESLIEQIKILPSLPAIDLNLNEWQLLEALWEGLPILVAHLQLMFRQYNKVDFTEVNLKALEALGEEDNPTDLALILDYQIKHLLVDEFQDTSSIQYQLFEKIVSGWQPDDGRTIFVVGDPMQSIYRFRGAEVGLYLKLQQQGFGCVQPANIVLSSNFRSDKNIVDWVNASFRGIFSKENDMVLSKISYSPSSGSKTFSGSGVFSYQFSSDLHEAQYILNKIQKIKLSDPQGSIAILVRARHHAQALFHELSKAGMAYQAIDMMSLKNSQLIIDLLTLTRMIEQVDNKLACYSILRSPVCGLSLADLLLLSQSNQDLSFIKNITLENLSQDGQIRANKILTILNYWQENHYRLPLHQSIRHLWVSLGFEQYYQDKVNADSYFELLKTWEEGNQFGDFNALEQKLESLFQVSQSPASVSASIQIMTIHKSKGLEFDYVFVPGLHHTTVKEDQPLVIYHEIPYDTHVDWLIAPKYANNKPSMLYDYIYSQLQQKATYETQRVLYVAATRAKKQLIWSYVKETEKENPAKDSFLAMLAPYLNTVVISQQEINQEINEETGNTVLETQYSPFHRRIISDNPLPWRKVESQFITKSDVSEDNPLNRPVVKVYEKLAIIGSYLHRLFASWHTVNKMQTESHKNNLLAMGLYVTDLDYGLALVLKIIQQCEQDVKFNWIMDTNHDFIRNEFALNFVRNNKLQTRILDKFFIDKSNLSAWIIDFKLSLDHPNPSDHLAQLKEYAMLINNLGILSDKPLHFGLYYPYQSYWWEQESICA